MKALDVLKLLNKSYGYSDLRKTNDGKPYLGVSFPELKTIANQINKDNPNEFLESNDFSIYELEIIQAMVIGKIKDYQIGKKYFLKQAKIASSWSVVDALCQKFILTKRHREDMFKEIVKFADSKKEFKQRIAAVLLLSHYLEEKYLEKAFSILKNLKNEHYYAKMGVAWAVATYFTYFPKQTLAFLENSNLETWTHNKAIQKIKESFKISDLNKKKAEELKR
jgi:3-methyladenine DNA glycosylase AlkD